MPTVPITKKTKWECQRSGNCCRGIILSKMENLSIMKENKPICKHLTDANHCAQYSERPFICRIYPFVVDYDKMRSADGIARPKQAFALENLKIHTECPGYGKGKRVYANKALQKHFDKLCYDFSLNLKKAMDKKIKVKEVI